MKTTPIVRVYPSIAMLMAMFLTSLLGACALGNASRGNMAIGSNKVPAPPRLTLSSADKQRYDSLYLNGVQQFMAERNDSALHYLRQAIAIDSTADESYYVMAKALFAQKQDSVALPLMEKAAMLRPDNMDYREMLMKAYYQKQQTDKVLECIEVILAKQPHRTDLLKVQAYFLAAKGEHEKALAALQRIETIEGVDEQITLDKLNLLKAMGRIEEGTQTLKTLLKENPDDTKYPSWLANWYIQNNRPDLGYGVLQDFLKTHPDNAEALFSLYDYYRGQKQDSLARATALTLLSAKNVEDEVRATLLKELYEDNEKQGGDSLTMLRYFETAVKGDTANVEFLRMQVDYMLSKKFPADSVAPLLHKIVEKTPNDEQARLVYIQSVWDKHDWPYIVARCEEAGQHCPETAAFPFFKGMALMQLDKNRDALAAFQAAIAKAKVDKNTDLLADAYAASADLYHQLGHKKEAYAAYDSCLALKPDNVESLNNYAYFLSEDGIRLTEALAMSYKTVQAQPKNATFLDTYAWILFMDGRFAEAKIYIDQALAHLEKPTGNGTIYEHAGDIYACNNDIDTALKHWEEARKQGASGALLLQKIKQRKYIPETKK